VCYLLLLLFHHCRTLLLHSVTECVTVILQVSSFVVVNSCDGTRGLELNTCDEHPDVLVLHLLRYTAVCDIYMHPCHVMQVHVFILTSVYILVTVCKADQLCLQVVCPLAVCCILQSEYVSWFICVGNATVKYVTCLTPATTISHAEYQQQCSALLHLVCNQSAISAVTDV